ncbi:MAG: hypothetical protein ACYS8W_12310, partial [Planctomycetota bacterium]
MRRIAIFITFALITVFLGCTGEEGQPPAGKTGAGPEKTAKTVDTRAKAVAILKDGIAFMMKGYNDKDGALAVKE